MLSRLSLGNLRAATVSHDVMNWVRPNCVRYLASFATWFVGAEEPLSRALVLGEVASLAERLSLPALPS
jgi:hypothetical protein